MSSKPLPAGISKRIMKHLDAIAEVFESPKVTLVVRNPVQQTFGDTDVIITADDLDSVIMTLEYRQDEIRAARLAPYVEREC